MLLVSAYTGKFISSNFCQTLDGKILFLIIKTFVEQDSWNLFSMGLIFTQAVTVGYLPPTFRSDHHITMDSQLSYLRKNLSFFILKFNYSNLYYKYFRLSLNKLIFTKNENSAKFQCLIIKNIFIKCWKFILSFSSETKRIIQHSKIWPSLYKHQPYLKNL